MWGHCSFEDNKFSCPINPNWPNAETITTCIEESICTNNDNIFSEENCLSQGIPCAWNGFRCLVSFECGGEYDNYVPEIVVVSAAGFIFSIIATGLAGSFGMLFFKLRRKRKTTGISPPRPLDMGMRRRSMDTTVSGLTQGTNVSQQTSASQMWSPVVPQKSAQYEFETQSSGTSLSNISQVTSLSTVSELSVQTEYSNK